MIWLYQLSYACVRFFAKTFYNQLPEKIKHSLDLRESQQIVWKNSAATKTSGVIWFHAASGEIEYLKPLLRDIRQEFPQKKIFISFFSPSALLWIHKVDCDGWAPLPWDTQSSVSAFLDRLSPETLIVSRTDLWPCLLKECAKRKVPVFLFAATFASGSKKLNPILRPLMRQMLLNIKNTLVVSQEDLEVLKALAPKAKAQIAGDSRYDQVHFRLAQQKQIPIKNFEDIKTKKVFIAGSTWPEDEKVLMACLRQLIFTNPDLHFILVPHETTPEHLQSMQDLVKELNLSCDFFSELVKENREFTAQVLIVDQYGWLLDLYKYATCAFVGGSFKGQVHSVMEALGSGLPVTVGPYYLNNRESIDFGKINLFEIPLVKSAKNADELADHLRKILSLEETHLQALKNLILSEFKAREGATETIFKEIKQCL